MDQRRPDCGGELTTTTPPASGDLAALDALFAAGASAPSDPLALFDRFRAAAAGTEPEHATAMVLATADERGRPSARVVLLKGVDERGFSFFSHYESRKGRELATNPHAALCWYWPSRSWQVRTEGRVERLPAEESDAYFATRPRGSQTGAWASRQSEPLARRGELESRVAEAAQRFADREIPRPEHWGGFLLRPSRLEFWQGREDRLHDRWLYERGGSTWTARRLQP